MVNKFNEFLQNELNDNQKQAVMHKEGGILVIAGAGSGKTRVITSKIIHLILNEKADPSSIVALTFTNKAAGEMKERITSFLDKVPFIGTFHSYCLLLLRKYSHLAPFENFSILDGDDQSAMIRKIIKRFSLDKQISVAQAISLVSKLKNKMVFSPEEKQFEKPMVVDIYNAYESERKAAHSLDFDDLLIEVLKIFSTNPEFRTMIQSNLEHILVDEYQDTNMVQHELLRYLALTPDKSLALKSVCAVGDEDQSIYSWRGAIVENMHKFEQDFNPIVVKIEQNYRSVQPILKAANQVITKNSNRNKKNLWSDRKAQNRILAIANKSEYQEAESIANLISILDKKNDIAILYRTHFQSRVIEEALTFKSIPYKIIGGIQFYQRKEIKDVLAYLRLIANPFDKISFFRVINTPTRGVGAKFEQILIDCWEANPELDFLEVTKKLLDSEITNRRRESLEDFMDVFHGLDKTKKTSFLIKTILEKTDYVSYLKNTYDEQEAEVKIDNIRELQQSVNYNSANLETFLYEISLMQEKAEAQEDDPNTVLLMTLHAAKGLEFNTVIISGLEEGLFPSTRSLNSTDSIEEERRLFYVGITRAKERLILSYANTRNSFGQVSDQSTSRFFDEMPSDLMQEINAAIMHSTQVRSMFNQWLGKKNQHVTFFGAEAFAKPIKPKVKKTFSKNPWRKNQAVMHTKFGVGIIKKVEKKDDNTYFITALFKSGEKKLISSYLKPI